MTWWRPEERCVCGHVQGEHLAPIVVGKRPARHDGSCRAEGCECQEFRLAEGVAS